jgi:hypothetical protein
VPHVRHMPQLSGLRAPAARAREAAAG